MLHVSPFDEVRDQTKGIKRILFYISLRKPRIAFRAADAGSDCVGELLVHSGHREAPVDAEMLATEESLAHYACAHAIHLSSAFSGPACAYFRV